MSAPRSTRRILASEPQQDPRLDRLLADGCVSVAAAARHVGLSRLSIWRLMDKGELPYILVTPRKRLIPRSALAGLLARHLHVGPVAGRKP